MKKKSLTKRKAIELCIKLWEWLAKTGKSKYEYPDWEKYKKYIQKSEHSTPQCDCWFCEYADFICSNCSKCPLNKQIGNCEDDTFYGGWNNVKSTEARKKYAKLFLEQIKTLK